MCSINFLSIINKQPGNHCQYTRHAPDKKRASPTYPRKKYGRYQQSTAGTNLYRAAIQSLCQWRVFTHPRGNIRSRYKRAACAETDNGAPRQNPYQIGVEWQKYASNSEQNTRTNQYIARPKAINQYSSWNIGCGKSQK